MDPSSFENIFNKLYLIAAREKIKCSYEQYISIIREEFSRATIYEDSKNLIINLRGRVPMQIEDIDFGIKLGKAIINSKTDSPNTKKLIKQNKVFIKSN